MAKRTGAPGMIGFDGVRRRRGEPSPGSWMTRGVNSIFTFVRFAEFEILFILFILVAFIIFKDLTSRPEYNDILVKKAGGGNDWWAH